MDDNRSLETRSSCENGSCQLAAMKPGGPVVNGSRLAQAVSRRRWDDGVEMRREFLRRAKGQLIDGRNCHRVIPETCFPQGVRVGARPIRRDLFHDLTPGSHRVAGSTPHVPGLGEIQPEMPARACQHKPCADGTAEPAVFRVRCRAALQAC